MNRVLKLFLATSIATAGVSSARATTIVDLYNTGVNNSGTPLTNAAATIDPHYTITVNPDNTGTGAHTEDQTQFPIVMGPWIANSSTAQWISPDFNTSGAQGGVYTYHTTFTLPADVIPTSVSITGGWATDNNATAIVVNGATTTAALSPSFGSLTSFTLNAADGAVFAPGANTIDFSLNNQGTGYTGLYVDQLNGTYSEVPEPAGISLTCLLGAGLLARRRQA